LVSYDGVGAERWRVPLGPFRNFYGIAASPVLAGDTLLLLCDQSRGSFLLALDKNSGNELWRQDRPARLEAYSTPVLYPDAGQPRQVLVGGSRWVDAYDLGTGESVWSMTGVGTGPVASPVLAGDRLFVNAPDHAPEPPQPFTEITDKYDANEDGDLQKAELDGFWMFNHFGFADVDGNGAISAQDWETLNAEMVNDNWGLFAMRLPSDGGQPRVLWNQRKGVPYIPSVVVYDGVLYMVKDSIVTSLDPETGEVFKQGRLEGASKVYASPIAGDGKIYIATLDGKVIVLSAGEQWEVHQESDLGDQIHATPAIAGQSLLVRTKSKLYSFAQSSE
jgi:outer membrane protein assembly factor BamB